MIRREHLIDTGPVRLVAALALLLLAIFAPVAATGASAQDVDALATRVQFLHGATDIGEVEVHVNGQGELEEFGYGDVSDWVDIDAGAVQITITAERTGFNYILFDAVYPVAAGNDFYLVISDALILGGAFDTAALPADTGRIQFTQASVNTPAVNVVVSGMDTPVSITYPKTSDAMDVPAGSYDFDIQLAETGDSVATVTGFTVEAGKSYELVVIGDPTSTDKPVEIKILETDAISSSDATPVASPVATPVS
jgi:hypothetical protein